MLGQICKFGRQIGVGRHSSEAHGVMELSEMSGMAARELHCRAHQQGRQRGQGEDEAVSLGGSFSTCSHAGMTFPGLSTNRDPSPG